ncbi:MAG: AmmeMemoRadiSam system protein B [Candidatus Moraniibacteriota bacterium]
MWLASFFLFSGIVFAMYASGVFRGSRITTNISNEKRTGQDSTSVSVLITPHHLVADAFIEKVFRAVREKRGDDFVDRIILLSPNHFAVGRDWVVSSEENWETPSGALNADRDVIAKLRDSVFVGEGILDREHGVRNIFPFIKEYFPHARVVPLALRDGFPHEKADALATRLNLLSDSHTLLVVSADFSHYLDWNFSRFHDDESIEILLQSDASRVDSLDVDCSSCLRIALKYAKLRNAPNFQFLSRSSSLTMLGMNLVGSETSHITGYFSSEPSQRSEDVRSTRLLFSGRVLPQQMMESARRIFMGQDENIFEEGGEIETGVFVPTPDGVMSDVERVIDDNRSFSVRMMGRQRIAFVYVGVGNRSIEDTVKDIADAKKESDAVVVMWREGVFLSDTAHTYIDAGADLIVGRNTFPIESAEVYRDALIIPSLGRVFSDCHETSEICLGIVFGVDFSHKKTKYVFMPITREANGWIALATGDKRVVVLEKLSKNISDKSLHKRILGGTVDMTSER